MKVLILLLISQTAFSQSDIGSLKGTDLMALNKERIHNLVASSAEIRKSLEVGRDIAGYSEEDQKWADDYEKLMADESPVDYLKLASDLE